MVYVSNLKFFTPEHGSLTPEHEFVYENACSHRVNLGPSELYIYRVVYIFDVAANKKIEM